MSADININDKFSSYEELLVFKGNRKVYFYSIMHKQFLSRTSQALDYFLKRNPSRKASVNLKYSRIELACIHGGKKFVSETSGKRPNTRYSKILLRDIYPDNGNWTKKLKVRLEKCCH